MKRRIRFTIKNVILTVLVIISFVVFICSGAMLDIEQMWIPYTTMVISFSFWALFYFVNKDLLDDNN